MNLDTNVVVTSEQKKPCTFCLFVRYFAIFAFLLTVVFFLYNQSKKDDIAERQDAIMRATMEADMP
jgi:cbb3-type cytochrome oxidase subunit 3